MFLRLASRLLCLAGLLFSFSAGRATLQVFHPESGRPAIRDFRPTDYRGHPQVYGIAQGHDRIIYISTAEGILGFDGARWTNYPMPSAQVYELVVTSDGRIWAGGNDELGYFQPAPEGGLAYHSLRAQLPAGAAPWGRTTKVARIGDAVFFLGPRGVLRVDSNHRVNFWPTPSGLRPTLHTIGGQAILHLTGRGLFRLGDDTLEPFADPAPIRNGNRAVSTTLADGRVLFCGTGAGAFLLDPATGGVEHLPGVLDEIVRTTRVMNALTLPDGTAVIATSGQGLVLLSADRRTTRRLDRESGLADNAVLSLARDHEGGLWLGYNSGVARLALESNVSVFDATNGPTPGTIDIWGRHEGQLYVGTYDGLYRMEPADAEGRGGRFV
ncbi:MAG TPA: two-component regulator propeller domain-containing protein, partial [Lacunisphaera sp.]|nr:two-component regulator propeller domain-containing protein [Lacunisphaera sp.]